MSSYRSSSQVSVYNYPEHLNPFYEDEQHKRLRFWKIKKSNKGNGNKNGDSNSSGMRRGSFNFGSLRDLFPLRSFRMKKQSSALGINVTSESPPPLRRDFITYNKEDEDKYAAYDPHFRHTLDQRAFQRNAPYRSSLQNMNPTSNDLQFERNNRYRSTIQNGSTMRHSDGRYMYSGSITPTSRGRYLTDITPRMTPGSSMNSISTNPFDDDYQDDVEGTITANDVTKSENSATTKSMRKKKRRAPAPPSQAIVKGTSETENIEIRENAESKNGLDELSRLTAEFESFVKNSQNDAHQEPKLIIDEDEIITTNGNEQPEKAREIINEKKPSKEEEMPKVCVDVSEYTSLDVEKSKNNENVERIAEHHVIVRREMESAEKTIAIIQEDLKIKEIELKIKEDELRIKEAMEEVNNNQTLQIEKVVDESSMRKSSPDVQTLEVHQITTEIRKFPEIQRITPTPTPSREQTPDFIPLPVREKFDILRIDENENDLQKPEDIKEEKSLSNIQIKEMKILNVKERSPSPPKRKVVAEQIPEQPLQTKILTQSNTIQESRITRDRTPIPLARTEIESRLSSQGFKRVEKPLKYDDIEKTVVLRQHSQTDEDSIIAEDEGASKVPERRRSVKEIIESINRQQQKLKINQPPSPQLSRKYFYGEQNISYHEKPAVPSKENVLLKLQRQAENERRINALLDDLQDFSKENTEMRQSHKFPVTERDTNNNSKFHDERHSREDINPIPKPRRIM